MSAGGHQPQSSEVGSATPPNQGGGSSGYAPPLPIIRDALEPCGVAALEGIAFGFVVGAPFRVGELSHVAALSQAASLKRIADALETLAYGDNDYFSMLERR